MMGYWTTYSENTGFFLHNVYFTALGLVYLPATLTCLMRPQLGKDTVWLQQSYRVSHFFYTPISHIIKTNDR